VHFLQQCHVRVPGPSGCAKQSAFLALQPTPGQVFPVHRVQRDLPDFVPISSGLPGSLPMIDTANCPAQVRPMPQLPVKCLVEQP
jgi:hypothetical protein